MESGISASKNGIGKNPGPMASIILSKSRLKSSIDEAGAGVEATGLS